MIRLSAENLFSSTGIPMRVMDTSTARPTGSVIAESVKVVFALSGWSAIRSDEDEIAATTGTVVTIPASLECAGFPETPSRAITFYLHQDYLSDQVRWLAGTHPLVRQLNGAVAGDAGLQRLQLPSPALRALGPKLVRLAQLPQRAEQEFAMLSIASDVFNLVGRFAGVPESRVAENAPTLARPREEVLAAIELMRTEISRNWRIDSLAREVALSGSQLRRLFRSQVGVTPAACLAGLRAGRMAELLSTTSLSVAEAARASGWQNATAASRAFKRRYGMPPREYAAFARGKLGIWAVA